MVFLTQVLCTCPAATHFDKLRREAFVDQELEGHRVARRTTLEDWGRNAGLVSRSFRGRPRRA
jgi:hypothetical protein